MSEKCQGMHSFLVNGDTSSALNWVMVVIRQIHIIIFESTIIWYLDPGPFSPPGGGF